MKLRSKMLSVVLIAAIALFTTVAITGCGESENGETTGEPHFLKITTGSVSGTYYPLGTVISKVTQQDNPNIQMEVADSGGSVANANLIINGDAEFAIMQPDIANYAHFGKYAFEGKASDKLTAVASIYPEHIQVFATKASGISTIADLRGKRVALGDVGSGSEANALQILSAYGLTPDDFSVAERLDSSQAKDAMQDGRIDAAFFTFGIGSSALTELATNAEVTIVAISGAEREKLIAEYNFYQPSIVPAGSYRGIDVDIETVTMPALLVAHADVPSEVVEKVLTAMFDNIEEIHNTREILKTFKRENAASVPIPLHPGAKKYYDENPFAAE